MSNNDDAVIEVYMRNGDPYGVRTARNDVSIIKAVAFPRIQFSSVKNEFKEISYAGVYLLLGRDIDDNNRRVAYIGESGNVAKRLQRHISNKTDEKPYWIDTIALVSIDGSLNKQHVMHVESKLIAIANGNDGWKLPNKNLNEKTDKLTISDEIKVTKFIDQAKMLTGALGWDLFKQTSGNLAPAHSSLSNIEDTVESPEFYFSGTGFSATAIVSETSGDWIVKAASQAKLEPSNKIPPSAKKRRDQLQADGKLVLVGGELIFKEDCLFSSPSAAAYVVCGGSINGRESWRLKDGMKYSEWEMKQSEEEVDSVMKYEQIITDKGRGSLPRILDTINCFRRRFGTWPTRLLVDKDMAEALQQDNLTLAGWVALTKKLDVQYSIVGEVFAEDNAGNSFKYKANLFTPEDKNQSADYWIWGCAVWPES